MRVVTISASYGAGGSVIGPDLARRLGAGFLDRAVRTTEAATEEERTQGLIARLLSSFARMPDAFGPGAPVPEDADVALREETEAHIRRFAGEHDPAVILGWGATLVLPDAFRVRLRGPAPARLERAMAIEAVGRQEAERRMADTDRVRSTYVRRLYDRDWEDASLYHLVLDSTAMTMGDCVALLASAAEAFWR
ncbi:MAG TPA: cytidylate kinase-like family protein [Acidimicrobiales bacterium]|nr:cytidylate kinase-like family protein [Acidimicrobiales bacterium]